MAKKKTDTDLEKRLSLASKRIWEAALVEDEMYCPKKPKKKVKNKSRK